MSQIPTPSVSSTPSPFVRIQYEQAHRELVILHNTLVEVSDRQIARAWAKAFGLLMVSPILFMTFSGFVDQFVA